jgi:quinol monooxygenase YgiN
MSNVMVRYTVKPERAQENEQLVRAVYEELKRTTPAGLRYATFRLDDGVSFVHVASNETEDGHSPLREVKAFQEFVKDIAERCAEPPVTRAMQEVGSFRFWQ